MQNFYQHSFFSAD